jgi:hypothetical protein
LGFLSSFRSFKERIGTLGLGDKQTRGPGARIAGTILVREQVVLNLVGCFSAGVRDGHISGFKVLISKGDLISEGRNAVDVHMIGDIPPKACYQGSFGSVEFS